MAKPMSYTRQNPYPCHAGRGLTGTGTGLKKIPEDDKDDEENDEDSDDDDLGGDQADEDEDKGEDDYGYASA